MRRREAMLLAAAATLAPRLLRAQQSRMPLVGFLHSLSADRSLEAVAAFRDGLAKGGYVDGRDVLIEYRWADGHYERLDGLAANLVAGRPDVIVAGGGTPPAAAAKNATSTIPIVFASVGDPVETGLVASFARPGGNITGISVMTVELMPKRLELLLELVPGIRRIALLANPKIATWERTIAVVREAAAAIRIKPEILNASTGDEVGLAFAALARSRPDALVVAADPFFFNHRNELVNLAARYALPAIYELRGFVDAGGLMSYGTSLNGNYRQAGSYVARILAGAKPDVLPVQRPTKFELVINLKTARELGLAVPQSLLARADEVIE